MIGIAEHLKATRDSQPVVRRHNPRTDPNSITENGGSQVVDLRAVSGHPTTQLHATL